MLVFFIDITRVPHFLNLSTPLLYRSMELEKRPTIDNPFDRKGSSRNRASSPRVPPCQPTAPQQGPNTTIENPFAHNTASRKRPFAPRKRPVDAPKISPDKSTPESIPEKSTLYEPPFYVSHSTKTYVAAQLEKGNLDADELEKIYTMAQVIGRFLSRSIHSDGRKAPTLTDIQLAIKIRTIEYARKLASGEEQLDIVPYDKALEVMQRKDRLQFWKYVAEQVVAEYDKTTT